MPRSPERICHGDGLGWNGKKILEVTVEMIEGERGRSGLVRLLRVGLLV